MDERVAIGVAMTGTFAPASRKQAVEYIQSAVTADLSGATQLVKESRLELARNIKQQLAASTPTQATEKVAATS